MRRRDLPRAEGAHVRTLAQAATLYFALVLCSVVFLLPVAWMLSMSVQDLAGTMARPFRWLPDRVHLGNYTRVFTAFPFGQYLLNTSIITGAVMAATLLSSSLVAYGFSRLRFRGRDTLFAVCLATMMLPGQVTMIPLYMGFASLGWVDTFLPLIVPSLFGSPFFIFLLRQFFLTIPQEFDEAALIDGAGRLRIYWSIVLPLSRPAMATVALFTFIGTWNDFLGPLIYINSPDKATLTLGLHLLKSQITGTGIVEWHILMAAALLVMAPNVVVFLLAQRHFVRGLAVGGLRG